MASKLFSFWKKSTPEQSITPTFLPIDFVNAWISNSLGASEKQYLNYYLSVPQLNATINYRADLFASMKVKMRRIGGEDVEKNPVLNLLNNPNPLQSFKELAKQYSVSKDIFGEAYMHPVFGVDPMMSKALYILPGLNAEIEPTHGSSILFNQTELSEIVSKYYFYFDGAKLTYKPDEIWHGKDLLLYTGTNEKTYLKGVSKLKPLTQICENIITSNEARGIMQGNAPVGIISNRTKDSTGTAIMRPGEKESVQEELKKYGMKKDKYQFIVTSASLDFSSMATNIGNI